MKRSRIQKLVRKVRQWRFEQKAKRDSLKRKGNGPFRGATPKNIFQTIDVGGLHSDRTATSATRNPRRQYLTVDPRLKPGHNAYVKRALEHKGKVVIETEPQLHARLKSIPNLNVEANTIENVLTKMEQHGQKTRYVNIDMPDPMFMTDLIYPPPSPLWTRRWEQPSTLERLVNVLVPNGKIYVTSEGTSGDEFQKFAKEHGLKFRRLPPVRPTDKSRITEQMRSLGVPSDWDKVYRFEITKGLKKAIPDKNQRRNWPREK